MGAPSDEPGSGLRDAKQYLESASPLLFHHGFAWGEPVLTGEWLRGIGVGDLPGHRCRAVGSVLANPTARQMGAGRPRSPLRRLARKAIAAVNAPQEFLFEADRVLVRSDPEGVWEDYSHALLDGTGRRLQGDPLWPLEMLDAPEWAVHPVESLTDMHTRYSVNLAGVEARLPQIVVETPNRDAGTAFLIDLQWDQDQGLKQFAHYRPDGAAEMWQVLRFAESTVPFDEPDLWALRDQALTQ